MLICENVRCWHVECWHVRMWDVNMWNVNMWECEMSTCENLRCQHVRMWDVNMRECEMSTCENVRCQHVRVWEYVMSIFHGFENVRPEVNHPWIWEHTLHDVDFTRFLRVHTDVNIENVCCIWPDVGYAWAWDCAPTMYNWMLGMHELENAHAPHMMGCWVCMKLQMHMHWACMYRWWLVNMHCIHTNVEYARAQYNVDNWEWEWCQLQYCCTWVLRWGHKHVRCE